jgi:hypothetical protein
MIPLYPLPMLLFLESIGPFCYLQMGMDKARKVLTTLIGLVCTHLARTASILWTHDTSVGHDVLSRQVPTSACHADFLATLLPCHGCLHRPGGAARVFESAQAQAELA